jgi:hypothetical protein
MMSAIILVTMQSERSDLVDWLYHRFSIKHVA